MLSKIAKSVNFTTRKTLKLVAKPPSWSPQARAFSQVIGGQEGSTVSQIGLDP